MPSSTTTQPGVLPQGEPKALSLKNLLANRVPLLTAALLGLFATLLASFPARNFELWSHLAAGRAVFEGRFSTTWLYDLSAYGVASVAGGGGLVACKAVLCGLVAVLIFRASAGSGWRVAFATTGLSVLAMGNRLLVQPETASLVCLAVAVWLLHRRAKSADGFRPDWWMVGLFALWCNLDAHFVLGLGVVILARLGRVIDDRRRGHFPRELGQWAVMVVSLVAVSCLSPSHARGLIPRDLLKAVDDLTSPNRDALPFHSPFDPDYFAQFQESSAALAYYPLLALGVISFLLNVRGWRWAWALPWVGMAAVSVLEARTIPLFAVVAGPVTAWNLQAVLARRPSAPVRSRSRALGLGVVGLISVAFLVAAWPGLLQGQPYEPRRWAADAPPAVERGAEFLRETHDAGLWAADSRTLHVTPDTLGALAWLFPQDRGLFAPNVVEALLTPSAEDAARALLREYKVSRVVAYIGDSAPLAKHNPTAAAKDDPTPAAKRMIRLLFTAPDEWRVIWLGGGLVVFGWDDPDRGGPSPFDKWAVDFDRLGYHPDAAEQAPAGGPPESGRWWEVFWTPARPVRPPGRDEANALLLKAEALRAAAPARHMTDWQAGQLAALVGAGGGGVVGPMAGADAAVRLTLFEPPLPEREGVRLPPQTELVFAFHQRFVADRGSIPVGVVYAAVRAARRAVADNPNDAAAHLALAQAYATLMNGTCEQGWAARLPQVHRVRLMQVLAALNRAVAINPRLAAAHLELARLYRTNGFLDLAVDHLRAYKTLSTRWGGPRKGDPLAEAVDADLSQWAKTLENRLQTYEKDSTKASVYDRARRAVELELGGKSRDILLKSDVSAFGIQGAEKQVDLLLYTGRPREVLNQLTDEWRAALTDEKYYFFRAMAWLAVGDYKAADAELGEMIGVAGRLPDPKVVLNEVTELVGTGVLDGAPLGVQPHDGFWREPARDKLEERVTDFTRTIARHANITVLRGILALERGDVDLARDYFREPLAFAPGRFARGGQLLFQGQDVMWDGLTLIGERPQTAK